MVDGLKKEQGDLSLLCKKSQGRLGYKLDYQLRAYWALLIIRELITWGNMNKAKKKKLEKEGWIEHKTFWAKKSKYGTAQISKNKKEVKK